MSISKGVTALVTEATGAIGPRVVHALCVAGYLVRTFSLDTPETELFPPNVDEHIGDITDPSAVQSAIRAWMQLFTWLLSCTLSIHRQKCVKNTSASMLAERRR